jgi:hypothetical protein
MVVPAVEGMNLFKIAGRSISGGFPAWLLRGEMLDAVEITQSPQSMQRCVLISALTEGILY